MVSPFDHPVLHLAVTSLDTVDADDAPSTLWIGINKSKDFIQEGDRIVNISWRLWHLQLASHTRHIPPSPPSSLSSGSASCSSDIDEREWQQQCDSASPDPRSRRKSSNSAHSKRQDSPSPSRPSLLTRISTQSTIASSAPTSFYQSSSHFHSQSLPERSAAQNQQSSVYRPRSLPTPSSHIPGTTSEHAKRPGRRIPIGRIIRDILPRKLQVPPPRSSRPAPVLVEPQPDSEIPPAPHPTPLLHSPNPTLILINPTPRPTPPGTPHTSKTGSGAASSTHLTPPVWAPGQERQTPPNPNPPAAPVRIFATLPKTDSNTSNSTASTEEEEEERAMKGIFFIHKSPPAGNVSSAESQTGAEPVVAASAVPVEVGESGKKGSIKDAGNQLPIVPPASIEEGKKIVEQPPPPPPAPASSPSSPLKQPERLPRPPSTEIGSASSRTTRSTKPATTSTESVKEYKGKTVALRRPRLAAAKRSSRPALSRRYSSQQQIQPPSPAPAPTPPQVKRSPPIRAPIRARSPEPEFESTSSSWSSDSSPPPPSRQQQQLEMAAMEAARQRDMFTKLPPRSYSNLGKSDGEKKAGMLSVLLNPDARILATLGAATKSTGNLSSLPGGTGRPNGWGMPGKLKGSKSAAEVRVAPVSVTASQMPQVAQKLDNGGRGYRLKGKPEGVQVEMETSDEEDDNEPPQIVGSLAQRRLEAFARGKDQYHQRRASQENNPGPSSSTNTHTPVLMAQPEAEESLSSRPLPFPYNLPAPQPPQTPRTTRRAMLQTEMSESLRRQLLWERESTKRGLMQGLVKVKSAHNVRLGGLKPLTKLNEADETEEDKRRRRKAEEEEEEEKRERKKLLAKRTKSWSEEYHATGW